MRKIDLESHFYTPEYIRYLESRDVPPRHEVGPEGIRAWLEPSQPDLSLKHSERLKATLLDLGQGRVDELDRVGIDVQCLSLSSPGLEQFEPEGQVDQARKANDVLAGVLRDFPGRYIGMASLPMSAPEVAVEELERCVTELGFKGVNIHSHIGNTYLDDPRYFPVLEKAAQLGVPIDLHPTLPHANMLEPYLGYGWALPGPGLGFGHETAVHAMRMIYAGIFDRLPALQIILGHFGEGLCHWVYRVDFDFNKPWMDKSHRPKIERDRPSDYLRENFWYTSSGNFVNSALMSTMFEIGADRIMFASDYAWETMDDAVEFIDQAPVGKLDKEKICFGNAERLFGL
jgi:predicted TIM-barrel fold metal-dependent hydrolase